MNYKTLALIALALLSVCMPATLAALPAGSEYGDIYYVGESLQFHTEAQICAHYGGTGLYGNMYYPIIQWADNGIHVSQDDWASPGAPWTVTSEHLSPTYYVQEKAICNVGEKYWMYYNLSSGTRPVLLPGINFTATPTYGYLPLLVSFTGTMNTTPSIVKWNFGDGTVSNTSTSTLSTLHTYSTAGIYTVRLDTFDSTYGWQNFTRSEYITATNPSGVVFNVDIKDSISGQLIQDTSFGVQNTSTGVWRYTTAPTGLLYVDTTDPGYLYPLSLNQTVTIAANKTGYTSASKTFAIPYDNYREYLYLVPSTVVNATGTGTVVATVITNSHGLPIPGASITLDTGQIGITNSAGAVTLLNVTAGNRYASVSDSGYQSTTSSFTLTAGETKMVVIQMVRDGETPVPTFAEPTVTPVPTDAYGNPITGNTSAAAVNQRGSSGLLGMLDFVIGLWPLIFILGFLKFCKMCTE